MHNLNIYKNETSLGYGGSQKIAYRYAIEKGYDLVVMLHGDANMHLKIYLIFSNPLRTERPIPTHYGSERNYVNVWRYGLDVLYTLIEYLLHQRGIRRVKKFALD